MYEVDKLRKVAALAGLHVKGLRVDSDDNFKALVVGAKGSNEKIDWNPLTDDGDALRLAVRLGLVVEVGYAARGFVAVRTNTDNWREYREAYGTCVYAAVRKAIVRAASQSSGPTTFKVHDDVCVSDSDFYNG